MITATSFSFGSFKGQSTWHKPRPSAQLHNVFVKQRVGKIKRNVLKLITATERVYERDFRKIFIILIVSSAVYINEPQSNKGIVIHFVYL